MGILGFRKKNEQKLTFLESTRYARDNKEEDLHRLVSSNPKLVALEQEEGQQLPTATIGDHMRLPSGELDLLLMDIVGNLTVVELKRDRTPRDVIAQILDYASDLNQMTIDDLEQLVSKYSKYDSIKDVVEKLQERNPEYEDVDITEVKKRVTECLFGKRLQLLVSSYEVNEAIRKVANYLRNSYGMKIYCVEFDYFEGNNSEYFIPEIIGTEEVKRIEKTELTATQKSYKAFWGELLDRLREKLPGITHRSAPPTHFISLLIGYTGIHLEWAFHGQPRSWFEVGLHFEKGNVQENKKLFDHFVSVKNEIENELGGVELEAEFPWMTKCGRIYAQKPEGQMTEDLKDWALDTMERFHSVFKPRLDEFLKS